MALYDPLQTLILVALEDELPQALLPQWRISYTGVGKINAAYNGLKAIIKFQPKMVINFGSAGALKEGVFGIHEVSVFKQRDMDVRGLGVPLGDTPFEKVSTLDNGRGGLSCGTGDSFVTSPPELATDLVDMEAYALAKICQLEKIPFHCYKYISDKADGNADQDWKENLAKGAKTFSNMLA